MTLLALQRDMRSWLVREDVEAADRLGHDAAPGLRVHQNNYRAALVACLEASFARTHMWIGEQAFLLAAVRHIERQPPSSWTLDAYARDFPDTLAMLYPGDPEVMELAWLELALEEAFVGPDAPDLNVADLAGVDWDRAVLRTTPTLNLGDLTTNATEIWSALGAGASVPMAELRHDPGAVLVWRHGAISRFRAIDRHEALAVRGARAGVSFAILCKAAVQTFGEKSGIERAGAWLGCWISDGILVGVGDGA